MKAFWKVKSHGVSGYLKYALLFLLCSFPFISNAEQIFEEAGSTEQSSVIGVSHIGISTGDLERSLRFYRDPLGFAEIQRIDLEPTKQREEYTGLKDSYGAAVFLKAGSSMIEIIEYKHPKGAQVAHAERPISDHFINHICFEVSNLRREYTRLKAAGVEFQSSPQEFNYGGSAIGVYGRDPDGNAFEMFEVLKAEK